MKLVLVAVGRMKNGPERELLKRYLDRAQAAARSIGIGYVSEIEIDESRARESGQRKREEASSIRGKLPTGAHVVMLDERGRSLSSVQIAGLLGETRDQSKPAFCFVIGGPDGLAPDLLTDYDTLGFGAATFPHQLIRVLVAEQMYRAITILAGHPYHRE